MCIYLCTSPCRSYSVGCKYSDVSYREGRVYTKVALILLLETVRLSVTGSGVYIYISRDPSL